MPKGKKKKVVFFDAGGTLFRPYPSVGHVYARVAAQHGVEVDAGHVDKTFHAKWHERNGMATLAGLTSEKIERDWWYKLVQDVFGNLGQFSNFDVFFHELYDLFAKAECWRLFDDTVPALQAMKKKGYRMGIISNWDHRLFTIVEQLGLKDFFENVTASAVVGVAKPGRQIFEAALASMGAKANQSVHIGDSMEDDYHGAARAGLQAVLIDRAHPRRDKGSPASGHLPGRRGKAYNDVVRIDTLHQLSDLLK